MNVTIKRGSPERRSCWAPPNCRPAPSIGFHTHPGDEFGYVLKGPLVLKTKGQPDRMLKTDDVFFNARGLVHSLSTASGGDDGTALSTWIVDKGEPLATPVTN